MALDDANADKEEGDSDLNVVSGEEMVDLDDSSDA